MQAFQFQRKQTRLPLQRPAPHIVSLQVGPRVQAKTACACGGSCPSCREASAPSANDGMLMRRPLEDEEVVQEKASSDAAADSNPSAGIAIQPKLKIGAPDDIYEREADAVADRVMRMTDVDTVSVGVTAAPTVGSIMREQMEGEEIQTKRAEGSSVAGANASAAINRLQGGGRPLAGPLRNFYEQRMGADFSHVRIHDDSAARAAARSVGARAFTLGNDVAFASGEFAPATAAGRHLLAHELTHVMQQQGTGIAPTVQRAVYVCDEFQTTNSRNFGPGINVSCSGNAASVTANMEISGSLATTTYANTMKSTIENHWTKSLDEGYQVNTTANIAVQGANPNTSKTGIEIVDAEGVSNVSRYWAIGARHMQYYDKSSDINWTPAHEFGHLLGLGDQYSANNFAQIFGADRETTADSGWSGNIMAEHNGVVEKKNVQGLLSNCTTSTCVRGHLESPI